LPDLADFLGFLFLNQLDVRDENLFSVFLNASFSLDPIEPDDCESFEIDDVITLCKAYSRCCLRPVSVKYSNPLITYNSNLFKSNSLVSIQGLALSLLDSEEFDIFERTTSTLAIDLIRRIDTNIYKNMASCILCKSTLMGAIMSKSP
jgi:hypothetical protein